MHSARRISKIFIVISLLLPSSAVTGTVWDRACANIAANVYFLRPVFLMISQKHRMSIFSVVSSLFFFSMFDFLLKDRCSNLPYTEDQLLELLRTSAHRIIYYVLFIHPYYTFRMQRAQDRRKQLECHIHDSVVESTDIHIHI